MRRAACLLLLFAVWLLAAPGASAPRATARVATISLADDALLGVAVHQVAPQAALPRVLRAPLWARLPALPRLLLREHEVRLALCADDCSPDLRAALRRVLTRRRAPRLSSEEPPWS